MAKKADETKKVTSQEVANSEDLKETEKTALEVEEATAQNEEISGKKFKLADPKTSYQDRDFQLAGDQTAELPEDPSADLIARIRSGFIVEA